MDMIAVESSNIAAIGYDEGTLAVQFKDGAIYHYADVPPEEFATLGAAASKGRYLHTHVMPRYKAAKILVPDKESAMDTETPLGIGETVLYRLETGPHKGELRPAIVVRIWGPEMANLQVLTDGGNDGLPCPYWATSVHGGGGEREWRRMTHSTGANPVPPGPPDYPRVPNHQPFA